MDGSITITESKITVINPGQGGRYPTIEPSQNLTVFVNGEPVAEATIVTAEDDIRIETTGKEPYLEMNVEISDDRLSAFMVINRYFGREFRVRDCSPCLQARVATITAMEIPPRKISPREIIQLLSEKGICGVSDSAISRICECNTEGEQKVLVARGRPATPSQNAVIKYTFLEKPETGNPPENPFQKTHDLSVEVGAVLAVKSEAIQGTVGVDIFGAPIKPKPPQDVEILAGDGVRLIKNNTVAVASQAGRPVLDGRRQKVLKVIPVYTVPGDVDINVGSISFKGDIVIWGDVLEGFCITAGRDITVHGNVIQAQLYAGGNINLLKNVISSELNAGGTAIVFKKLMPHLNRVFLLIQNLLQAMQVLKKHHSFKLNDLQKGEGRLFQLLIDTKFKMLPQIIQEIFDIISSSKVPIAAEYMRDMEHLHKLTGINPSGINNGQEVFNILRIMEGILQKMQEDIDFTEPSNITLSYTQNSIINASGDITVTGRGAIISKLSAGGDININFVNAVVRGGQLSAHGKVNVRELGSNADVICIVEINEGSVLEAQLVHPAVTVKSNWGKYQFDRLSRSVKAYIKPEGKLEIEKLNVN